MARLNQAGIPCGVLVAPVLPGLSDRPEQLEAVVKACIDAGARSISPLLLHLRPGVREHYLGWLAGEYPELLDQYRRLYPTAYAPGERQRELSRRVAELVARHGGRAVPPQASREEAAARRQPEPRRPRPPRQLPLGM